MWGHVRRWAGIMIAIILVKPVIVIVLGLAGALSADDGPDAFSAVVSGLAIILLAIFASRDDLPLRPRLRRRDRQLPQQPLQRGADERRPPPSSARPPPSSPRASRPTAAAATRRRRRRRQRRRPAPANPVSGGVAAHSTAPAAEAAAAPAALRRAPAP